MIRKLLTKFDGWLTERLYRRFRDFDPGDLGPVDLPPNQGGHEHQKSVVGWLNSPQPHNRRKPSDER